MCIYICVCGNPPKTYLSSKFSGIYSVFFLTFWTLKLRAFFVASLSPSHPSLSTSDPRFKIQDPKKTFWIQGGRIQDSRCRIQDSRFKIQKDFLNPRGSDSRFKIPKKLLESEGLQPWILNFESKEVGLTKFFLSLESWILNPKRLDWRVFFFWALNLGSWI